MLKMFQAGTWNNIDISIVEKKHGAKYLGYWSIERGRGRGWAGPVDVFYQPNPKTELGHSSYFGLFVVDVGKLYITDAKSFCPFDGMTALKCGDEVIVSHYRHDMRPSQDGKAWIDGGRDYTRRGKVGTYGRLFVEDGKFIFIALDSLIPEDVEFIYEE